MSKKWLIEYTCNFLGHYGTEVVETPDGNPPDDYLLEELAMFHFSPMAHVVEEVDGDADE